jgi:hypothetical protein
MKLLLTMMVLCTVGASAQRFEYDKAIGIGIDSLWQNEQENVVAAGFEPLGPAETFTNGDGFVSTTGIVKLMGFDVGGLSLQMKYGLVTRITLAASKSDFKRWVSKLKKLKAPSRVDDAGILIEYNWIFDNCEVSLSQSSRNKHVAELTITPVDTKD